MQRILSNSFGSRSREFSHSKRLFTSVGQCIRELRAGKDSILNKIFSGHQTHTTGKWFLRYSGRDIIQAPPGASSVCIGKAEC